jgi:hypothetical protein
MFHVKVSNSRITSYFPAARTVMASMALSAGAALAQPDLPAAPYIPCQQEPTGAAMNDTVASGVVGGWISLFDGETQKGWWQSCGTAHSGPAKFKVVPELKAISSTQDGSKGGLLMTNKKYLHYELQWDYWPDYGNDGGLFNRSNARGDAFQTVLDYIGTASLGGTWGERDFGHRDNRPFVFSGNENTITIPGQDGGDEADNWTIITRKLLAAGQKFPCPTNGCTQTEWRALWDPNDWNQLRLQFYGGTSTDQRVRMKFWFRKIGATEWVPVSHDTTLMRAIPEGYIGLQVHGGGRFGGPKGTWYRNIKYTPLTPLGERIYPEPSLSLKDGKIKTDVQVGSHHLIGSLASDHEIVIQDMRGRHIQTIKGKAGEFRYNLVPSANGKMTMLIKTPQGVDTRIINRDNQQ